MCDEVGLVSDREKPYGTRRGQECEQAPAPAASAFFRRVLETDRMPGRALPVDGPDLPVFGTSHQRSHGAEVVRFRLRLAYVASATRNRPWPGRRREDRVLERRSSARCRLQDDDVGLEGA